MSEVNHYKAVTLLSDEGNRIGYDPHGPDVVMASDFDKMNADRGACWAEFKVLSRHANETSSALLAKLEAAHQALVLARQFVTNGVEHGYIHMPEASTPDPAHNLLATIEAALKAGDEPTAAGQWREGAPGSPWDSEWFLAQLDSGKLVVLKRLQDSYSYDFTTVDHTYFMAHKVKRWAQLSTSDYVAPDPIRTTYVVGVVQALENTNQLIAELENIDPRMQILVKRNPSDHLVPMLVDDLQLAAKTLRRYEALHRAKNTEESTAKAEVNAELAIRFEATIAMVDSQRCGDIPDFTPGNGNKARRRAAELGIDYPEPKP